MAEPNNHPTMLNNVLKTAWRSLTRNAAFSLINILGLALGLACSLLIFLWVQDERNMNGFHHNKADLYDVYERIFSANKIDAAYWTPGPLAAELKRRLPEIQYASAFDPNQATFRVGDKTIAMSGAAADSDFFKMFTYPILEGSAASALDAPDKIAISRKTAVTFFGSPAAAIDQPMHVDNNKIFRIAAIFEDPGPNSSDQFSYVVNWKFHLDTVRYLQEWIYRGPHTYIQLKPGVNPAAVGGEILHFMDSYLTTSREGAGFHIELGLQKFDEMYLRSMFRNGYPDGGRIEYVRLFTIVAIFILLIACINFMNLSTARSVKRAKEVGIRKTIGAARISLIGQFIGEAMLVVFFATAIALCLIACILPLFNSIAAKFIRLPLNQPPFWVTVVALILVTGFTAGSYPALLLSSLRPVKVLKGALKFSPAAFWFRKGLVIFQFTLSILLIIGMMVISRQVNYLQTVNLGFDRDNLIYIPIQGDLWQKYPAARADLTGMPGIQAVTRTDAPPQQTGAHAYDMTWEGKDPNIRTVVIHVTTGYGWLKMMNLTLLQGRDFSPAYATDTNAYI
ncbi:MAG TPA: ABC transporter permease, partial [Puia sp.]|nr:ABC transporter permease [Puia sp.]